MIFCYPRVSQTWWVRDGRRPRRQRRIKRLAAVLCKLKAVSTRIFSTPTEITFSMYTYYITKYNMYKRIAEVNALYIINSMLYLLKTLLDLNYKQ